MSLTTPAQRAARLLAFARELQRADTFADVLIATRDEIEAAVGYAHAWLFVAETEDVDEFRLVDIAGATRGATWADFSVLRVRGDAMIEEIVRSRDPVVVVDARTDPRTNQAIVEQLGNRTIINIPLRLLDQPFGAFGTGTFGDAEGCRPPTAEQLEYLVAMASQLSVASGRIRLHEERRRAGRLIEQATTRLKVLADSSHEFSMATTDFDGLLDIVAKRLSGVLGELCSIRLLSQDGESLEAGSALYDPDPEKLAIAGQMVAPQRLGEGIAGGVAATGEAVLIPTIDTAELVARTAPQYRAFVEQLGITSILIVPLKSRGRVLGVISMTRSTPSNPYTQEDLLLARDLADRAALAIDNARLVSDLEDRVAQRTAKLEEAHHELEAFSYSVAHDLRAPLRGMNGFSNALVEDYGDVLTGEAKHFLTRIAAGAERMGEMIDALLDLARVSRKELQLRTVDVSQLARSVMDELRATEPERGVTVVAAEGLTAVGDRQLLRVLFENLLQNAWKFTRKREQARIEWGSEEVDGVRTFYVRDNGAGFDMAHANRLFIPFRRLHSVQEFDGTGIGLATVQRIVRHHGGRIWAAGNVDEGATFRFTLAPPSESHAPRS
jgi:K+-sensing histidine kinase KdpD